MSGRMLFTLAKNVEKKLLLQSAVYQYTCLTNRKFTSVSSASKTDDIGVSLIGRDFLTLKNFTPDEIGTLLWTAKDLKTRIKEERQVYRPLQGKTIAMLFQKRSTRTRLSTEAGMAQLGGHACFLGPNDIHLGVNESIRDSARTISKFSDLILARVFDHKDVEMLADEGSIPVINGLSNMYHPLQILADLLTLYEKFGYLRGLRVAWVGDGNNNICHSLLMGCVKMGIDIRVATPLGFESDNTVTGESVRLAVRNGTQLHFTVNPLEAVDNADAIITDTWVSMGQEDEKAKRLEAFAGYQVTRKMAAQAAPGWVFLHCLPRKAEEVTDDVFYDKERSLVWDEAENRKWTVMAVMLHLLQGHKPIIPKLNFNRIKS